MPLKKVKYRLSLHPTLLRRYNVTVFLKRVNCPDCKEIHGNRQTKAYTSSTAFFVHYTTQHTIDDEKKAFLRREIEAFQDSDYTQFHEFLKRARIE